MFRAYRENHQLLVVFRTCGGKLQLLVIFRAYCENHKLLVVLRTCGGKLQLLQSYSAHVDRRPSLSFMFVAWGYKFLVMLWVCVYRKTSVYLCSGYVDKNFSCQSCSVFRACTKKRQFQVMFRACGVKRLSFESCSVQGIPLGFMIQSPQWKNRKFQNISFHVYKICIQNTVCCIQRQITAECTGFPEPGFLVLWVRLTKIVASAESRPLSMPRVQFDQRALEHEGP